MKLKLKDPWSAITHGIALLLVTAGAAPLLLKLLMVKMIPPAYYSTCYFLFSL